MKKPFTQKKKELSTTPAESAPKPCISAEAYAALPPDEQVRYRAVDPKYERLPLICWILYGLAAVCVILYMIMMYSVPFADWFNGTVSAVMRAVFAALTSWIPFSLGELVIWMIPLILFLCFAMPFAAAVTPGAPPWFTWAFCFRW